MLLQHVGPGGKDARHPVPAIGIRGDQTAAVAIGPKRAGADLGRTGEISADLHHQLGPPGANKLINEGAHTGRGQDAVGIIREIGFGRREARRLDQLRQPRCVIGEFRQYLARNIFQFPTVHRYRSSIAPAAGAMLATHD